MCQVRLASLCIALRPCHNEPCTNSVGPTAYPHQPLPAALAPLAEPYTPHVATADALRGGAHRAAAGGWVQPVRDGRVHAPVHARAPGRCPARAAATAVLEHARQGCMPGGACSAGALLGGRQEGAGRAEPQQHAGCCGVEGRWTPAGQACVGSCPVRAAVCVQVVVGLSYAHRWLWLVLCSLSRLHRDFPLGPA